MIKLLNFEFMNEAMLKIDLLNIVKEYQKGSKAVDDISISAEPGEFLVLVGPSGCGKSTVLRMIAGLEDITSGDLLFNGIRMNDIEPGKRNIGMVFQNYALYPHLTVYENLAFPLKILKSSKADIDSNVKDIAGIIGLGSYLNRKPKELSGGQRQRVALGRALIRRPGIFLFDEPLSNLDAKLRVQMRTEIINLHNKANTTSVYVTHDQVEAMTMGTRIVVLDSGKVMQCGTPNEVYDLPKNIFVAGFLGSPQMNFFKGISHQLGIEIDGIIINFESEYREKQFTLGIRPEHIEITSENPDFMAQIEQTEFLGHEQLIFCKIHNQTFCIRQDVKRSYLIGEEIPIRFRRGRMHFFNTLGNRI